MLKQGRQQLIVAVCGVLLLLIAVAHAQYRCVQQPGGKLCTILPETSVASSGASVVDPTNCIMLQAIGTFQYCNRLGRTEACLGVKCDKPCKRFLLNDCQCDVLLVGPVKNQCMARFQADYIAEQLGRNASEVILEDIPDSYCAGKPRGYTEKYNCTTTSDPVLCGPPTTV